MTDPKKVIDEFLKAKVMLQEHETRDTRVKLLQHLFEESSYFPIIDYLELDTFEPQHSTDYTDDFCAIEYAVLLTESAGDCDKHWIWTLNEDGTKVLFSSLTVIVASVD